MTCRVTPDDPQLQNGSKRVSASKSTRSIIRALCCKSATSTKAKDTYDKCVDLLFSVPNNRPVAFRMPCCDSLNTVSPRF